MVDLPPAMAQEAHLTEIGFHAEGFPISDTPVTLTVFGSRDQNQADWDEVMMLNKSAERAGVKRTFAEAYEDVRNTVRANEAKRVFLAKTVQVCRDTRAKEERRGARTP